MLISIRNEVTYIKGHWEKKWGKNQQNVLIIKTIIQANKFKVQLYQSK